MIQARYIEPYEAGRAPRYLERGSGWTPAALFAGGILGGYYDPSVRSSLYQDSAMTTPVTADSDPVGAIKDLSGNGMHMVQATAAARPLYKTDGSTHWLQFDGVDDYVVSTATFTMTLPHFVGAAAEKAASTGGSLLFGSALNSSNYHTLLNVSSGRIGGAERLAAASAQATSGAAATPDATRWTSTTLSNGTNVNIRVGGGAPTIAASSWTTGGIASAKIGIGTLGSAITVGFKFFGGIVINADVAGDDLTRLDAWLAERI